MASNRINSSIQAEMDLTARISNLEGRAAHLETDFSNMLQAARELAAMAKQYVTRVELEQKSKNVLEKILETDQSGRTILNHLKTFFNFVLAKMQRRGAEITDIPILWHLLGTDRGVHSTFVDSVCSFGFRGADVEHLLVVLGMVYNDHMDMCRPMGMDNEKYEERTCLNAPQDDDNTLSDENRILEESYVDLDVEKYAENSTEDLKCWYVDENLRQVTKRAVAIVLCALNMEAKSLLNDTKMVVVNVVT